MSPRSVVMIGATERPGSVGAAVTRNALAGGFQCVEELTPLFDAFAAAPPIVFAPFTFAPSFSPSFLSVEAAASVLPATSSINCT